MLLKNRNSCSEQNKSLFQNKKHSSTAFSPITMKKRYEKERMMFMIITSMWKKRLFLLTSLFFKYFFRFYALNVNSQYSGSNDRFENHCYTVILKNKIFSKNTICFSNFIIWIFIVLKNSFETKCFWALNSTKLKS